MSSARFVEVDVNVGDVVMRVLMQMEITALPESLGRGADTQEDDHERNSEFKKPQSLRDDDAHSQHETPHDGQG